ncbi:hypothetical protein Syun_017526 [Stephania yunnanensis]|uniref:Uncharacterized protein n=1 Tax=Stephania yunnanensis TaxID=152371 RepID=A0AAP0J729_9MAGN
MRSGAEEEYHEAAAALANNLGQERASSRGRRGSHTNNRAGESRSTSTMAVDNDGDDGGEACAAKIFEAAGFSIWDQGSSLWGGSGTRSQSVERLDRLGIINSDPWNEWLAEVTYQSHDLGMHYTGY